MRVRHLASIDLLRGIAAFGIIGCHLALSPMTDGAWRLRALCDMNVGLFAALSGYLMWERIVVTNESWKSYFSRRSSRLLPIYLMWTILFLLFGLLFDLVVRHGLNPKLLNPSFWLGAVFIGDASTHLWFIICLFYAQIFFQPLAKRIPGECWFCVGAAINCLAAYNMNIWFCGYFLRLLSFLVTGYGIRGMHKKWQASAGSRSVLSIGMLALIMAVIGHYAFAHMIPVFIRDWLVAVPVLIVFVNLKIPAKWQSACSTLGRTSLAVFLVHPLVTAALAVAIRKVCAAPFSPAVVAIDWLLCWGISFFAAALLGKAAFARRFIQ